jgi:hypothetical protein
MILLLLIEALGYKPEGRGFDSWSGNFLQFTKSFQLHYDPGVSSASSRTEYQKIFLGSKVWPAPNADNLTAICHQIVLKMWGPHHLTTLQACT